MRPYQRAIFGLGAGVAASVAFGTMMANPDYGRALLTIWPCLALGSVSVAIALARGIGPAERGWLPYWVAGFVAYVVHLYFGFGLIYGASVVATFAGQGALVAASNFLLLAVWAASLVFVAIGKNVRYLNPGALALFAVSTLGSTLASDRIATLVGGGAIIFLWLAAIYLRSGKARATASTAR